MQLTSSVTNCCLRSDPNDALVTQVFSYSLLEVPAASAEARMRRLTVADNSSNGVDEKKQVAIIDGIVNRHSHSH